MLQSPEGLRRLARFLLHGASYPSNEARHLAVPSKVIPTSRRSGPVLSIVVPTFNERSNVRPLVCELMEVLTDIEWEVIFVDDDSPDGTADVVRELALESAHVRCIQRIGRRGLSSACVEGMLGSSAPYLAVMDGDLQHDPAIIPAMLSVVANSGVELVVGSRYTDGGSVGNWTWIRKGMSRLATRLGYAVVPETLKDPMSGFFMLRRTLLEEVAHSLSGLGFKILLDIFASARHPLRFQEVPFEFRPRHSGESKIDSVAVWEYLMLLADKLIGAYIPVRFVSFAAIGTFGIGVHLSIMTALYRLAGADFVPSQAIATVITMVFNYSLNNALTYRDRRRRGIRWLSGLASFATICSVGAFANVGVAAYLFSRQSEWVLAAIAGVLVGSIWNFAVSSAYTWGRPKSS
jgi:dolichol-phosphate mannosyltransferase